MVDFGESDKMISSSVDKEWNISSKHVVSVLIYPLFHFFIIYTYIWKREREKEGGGKASNHFSVVAG